VDDPTFPPLRALLREVLVYKERPVDDPTLPPLRALLREVLYNERPVDDPTLPPLSSKPLKSSLLDLSASSLKKSFPAEEAAPADPNVAG
jgi:hypothetical protein